MSTSSGILHRRWCTEWDLYRLIFARASNEIDGGDPNDSTGRHIRRGYRTLKGVTVRSEGERAIADFLFLSGVEFNYEQPYAEDVADAERSQYRPDFYYPSVDVWHEHWAIGYDGKPPKSFKGYAEGMKWKRATHTKNGTKLVETKWVDIIDTSGFPALAEGLEAAGLTLDWNPDRQIPGARPVDNKALARLVRTFMAHVKSNSLTREGLDQRFAKAPRRLRSHRNRLFIDLYWLIHERWEQRLRLDEAVDFEDMLVQAAAHIENGESKPSYDMVLVDEFQDASQARARLVAALVKPKGRYLLAVGDDWQAINRFAGADLSAMTSSPMVWSRANASTQHHVPMLPGDL